ncbi:MAG: DUF805 domain-containing protein [Nitrospinae bacterium]|nr:DUF805 domain-containing protein [Nitrospinota bacterium]
MNMSPNGLSPCNILFSFKGRISRSKYAIYWVGVGLVFALAFLVQLDVSKSSATPLSQRDAAIAVFFLSILLVATWANFALMVKRLHDCGAPVWLIFIPLVPPFLAGLLDGNLSDEYSAFVLFLSWACYIGLLGFIQLAQGTEGPNRHGSDPLKSNPIEEHCG